MGKILWGNCIVKNEDRYIWFAIKSVIDYLDKLIIYDTGSTDGTIGIIEDLKNEYPDKIFFEKKGKVNPAGLTGLRREMLDITESDWLLLLDGDEVWWEDSVKKSVKEINEKGDGLYALVNPTINLVGDIYHYQEEKAGEYKILGRKGHLNIRFINRSVPGLIIKNNYPLEGFYDSQERPIQTVEDKLLFINSPLLHFSHLRRSGVDDQSTLHRKKLSLEIGEKFPENFKYPEVFYQARPGNIFNPFVRMGLSYKLVASFITPLKKIRRKFKR